LGTLTPNLLAMVDPGKFLGNELGGKGLMALSGGPNIMCSRGALCEHMGGGSGPLIISPEIFRGAPKKSLGV